MNCTWKSTSQCLKLFKAIQHSNTMINMMFGPSGVSIMSMDTSKISLVRLILTPASFESFVCEQPMVFGIYTETLSNVLQKAKKATLHWKASNDGSLTIVLQEQDFKTEFTMRSIVIDDDYLEIPDMQDDVAFEVGTTVVQDWTSKVLMANSDVAFDIVQQQFVCSSESIELGEIKHTEPINGERIRLSSFKEQVNIVLSFNATKSLAIFASAGGDTCFVGFSNQQPSRIQVNLGEGSTLCLYVAPKILDD